MSARYSGLHPNDDAGHAMYEEQHRGHPDPNPNIPCAGDCGDEYPFQDYWEPRYVEPDDADPMEDDWLCDDCRDLRERREANRDLLEWAGDA